MKYANQSRVKVNRTLPEKGSKKPFLCIYQENIEAAAITLGGVAFKLYLYMTTNNDKYSFDYSPQHFSNTYGVSIQSARDAFKELIKYNYLVETEHNTYEFYETPQIIHKTIKPRIERRKFQTEDGTEEIISYDELAKQFKALGYTESIINDTWNTGIIVKE